MRILRRTSFAPTPWKNGGGITHEALRVPAGGGPFRWRVSVAQIEASGPFSDFAGYDRKMVLLRGAGLTLNFANGERRTLREIGELVEFDGALPLDCELLGGPCVDLNLMVAKSAAAVHARVERMTGPMVVGATAEQTTLVFPIDGAVSLATEAGETAVLEPWDLAVLSAGAAVRAATDNSADATLVFVATLEHENRLVPTDPAVRPIRG